MAGRPHSFDRVAQELSEWIQSAPTKYAEMLKGGDNTPFAATVSEAQKLDYYRRQVFSVAPDGSIDYTKPNTSGREMLFQRVGVEGYTTIMKAVMPKSGNLTAEQEETPVLADELYQLPEDTSG